MKILALNILLLTSSACLYSQNYNLPEYTIKAIQLKQLIEWTIDIDSTGNPKDSSHTTYFFDSLGRLMEKKYDFSRDGRSFVSAKYIYNNKGFLVDEIYENPYAVSFSSISNPPDSTEFTYYEYGRIRKKLNRWTGGAFQQIDYNYGDLYVVNNKKYIYFPASRSLRTNPNFKRAVKDNTRCLEDEQHNIFCPDYYHELLDFIDIKMNGIFKNRIRFEYYF